ncbi:MAG: RNA polymerase sigma factor [Planctomycetota bacterium JB042]
MLGHDADAEDAAQGAFLRIFAKAGTFDGRARFSTWVHRVTVRHALNVRRALRAERGAATEALPEGDLPAAPGPAPFEVVAGEELRAAVARGMRSLPDDARVVLTLRETEGLSYREIAETLGVPVGTVMSRLARARARLLRLCLPAERKEDEAVEVIE